jgi:hypothetical protein
MCPKTSGLLCRVTKVLIIVPSLLRGARNVLAVSLHFRAHLHWESVGNPGLADRQRRGSSFGDAYTTRLNTLTMAGQASWHFAVEAWERRNAPPCICCGSSSLGNIHTHMAHAYSPHQLLKLPVVIFDYFLLRIILTKT